MYVNVAPNFDWHVEWMAKKEIICFYFYDDLASNSEFDLLQNRFAKKQLPFYFSNSSFTLMRV